MIYFFSKVQSGDLFTSSHKIQYVKTLDLLKEWLKNKATYAVDTETTGLNPHLDRMLSIQMGDTENQFIIDLRGVTKHELYFIKESFESNIDRKVMVNGGFDYKFLLHHYNIRLFNIWNCDKVDEVLYNGLFNNIYPDNPTKSKIEYLKSFSMASMAKRYLDIDISKKEREAFIDRSVNKDFTEAEIEYMANDCIYPMQIFRKQQPLVKQYDLSNCCELENNVSLVLAWMEYTGVGFDQKKWTELAHNLMKEYADHEYRLDELILSDIYRQYNYKVKGSQASMFESFGMEPPAKRLTTMNWKSPDEVVKLLNRCNYSVKDSSRKSLLKYAKNSVLVQWILKHRELSKSLDSYGLSFLKNVNSITKRVHTNYNQLYPTTGRLSSENPNLQNIKKNSDYRDCFMAQEGWDLITSDYSAQELRLIAAASQDPVWLEAFKNGEDLHGKLCELTFKIDKSKVKEPFPMATDKSYRDIQKMIDFMLAYGGSEHKLSDSTGMSITEAQRVIKDFFREVPKVEKYLNESGEFGKLNGYCRTLAPIGRIRWFPEFVKLNTMSPREANIVLGEIERASKNSPIQGSGADMMKSAMVLIYKYIMRNHLWDKVRIVLQVHDEIVIECRKDFTDSFLPILKQLMLKAGETIVTCIPMESSVSVGPKWHK